MTTHFGGQSCGGSFFFEVTHRTPQFVDLLVQLVVKGFKVRYHELATKKGDHHHHGHDQTDIQRQNISNLTKTLGRKFKPWLGPRTCMAPLMRGNAAYGSGEASNVKKTGGASMSTTDTERESCSRSLQETI